MNMKRLWKTKVLKALFPAISRNSEPRLHSTKKLHGTDDNVLTFQHIKETLRRKKDALINQNMLSLLVSSVCKSHKNCIRWPSQNGDSVSDPSCQSWSSLMVTQKYCSLQNRLYCLQREISSEMAEYFIGDVRCNCM